MSDAQTKFAHPQSGEKLPAVWRDKDGVLHQAVGNRMVSFDPGTFIMWTACGQKDIPASKAWLKTSEDEVDCPACLETG